jgi:hypothetical protein
MLRCRRQPPQPALDIARRNRRQFLPGLPRNHLRQSRPRRNGCRTPPHPIASLRHPVPVKHCPQPQNIPASRIADLHRDRRRRQLPYMSWIPKMVQQSLAVHPAPSYPPHGAHPITETVCPPPIPARKHRPPTDANYPNRRITGRIVDASGSVVPGVTAQGGTITSLPLWDGL